jgi:hypothetical protein
LEQVMTRPSSQLVEDMRALGGDIMLLGVGEVGPYVAKLAVNTIRQASVNKKVFGVSRFSEAGLKEELDECGLGTIACDLLDDSALHELPDVKNIIYMAGTKFGTTG